MVSRTAEETTDMKYDKGYYENIDFIYQVVIEKFNRLSDSDNLFNNKVGFVLAGLIPLIAFYLSLSERINQTVLLWGLGLSFFSSVFLITALSIYNFYDPPPMDEIYSQSSFDKDIFDLKSDTAAKIIGDYHQNNKILKRKSVFFTIGVVLIIISILVVSSGFLYNGIYGKQQSDKTKANTCTYSTKT